MSSYRCGLQVNRSTIITDDSPYRSRAKLMSCMIDPDMASPKESVLSNETVTDEIQETLEAEKDAKTILQQIPEDSQEGEGLMEWIFDLPITQKITSKVKEKVKGTILKKGRSIGESLLAKASNLFPSSDENAADVFPGEFHAIVKLPNGKYGRASYSGPGTRIVERLKRGDKPRVLSDKVSQAHDIRYALATDEAAVRRADQIYVAKMKQLSREGLDSAVNIQPAQRAIQAKMVAEDFSLLSRDKFIDLDYKPSVGDRVLLNTKIGQLAQEGYGMHGRGSVQSRGKSGTDIRGVPQAGRNPRLSLADRVHMPLQNTSDSFLNRASATTVRQQNIHQRDGLSKIRDSAKGSATLRSGNRIVGDVVSHPKLLKSSALVNRLMRGGSQSPGMQASTASEYISIGTRGSTSRPRPMMGMGYRSSNTINIGTTTQLGKIPTIKSQMRGEPHTGEITEDIAEQGKLGSGSGMPVYPADKLLKKMRKKIKQKGTRRKPIYFDDHQMSSFLADKLVPMVMARG